MILKRHRKFLVIVLGLTVLIWHLNVQAQDINSHPSSNRNQHVVVDIVVDQYESGDMIPFLLDNYGNVWAFKDLLTEWEDPIRLKNLRNIIKLAPYIAVDKDGQVFTWALNDKKSNLPVLDEEGKTKAVYTIPKRVKGIKNATHIAYSDYHFVVVQDDRDIVEWNAIPSQNKFGLQTYTPIRKVYSREGVKKIAITGSSIIALYNDGKILGWGLSPTGQTRKDAAGKQISFDVANAVDVYLNKFHTVVLTKDGKVIYFGGCDLDGEDFNGKPAPHWGEVKGVIGLVTDVVAVAMQDNDNWFPDVFLKKDGSVCEAYAPVPLGIKDNDCGFMAAISKGPRCLDGLGPVIKVLTGNNHWILALGKDHHLSIPHYDSWW